MKLTTAKIASLLILVLSFSKLSAQQQMGYTDYNINGIQPFKINSGNNTIQIGTIFSSYIDLRQYPAGATPDLTKNLFKLKDARLDVKGQVGKDYEYNVQLDFAQWGTAYQPDGGPLLDANITYKGLKKLFNIKFGYSKVPFSLNSLVEHFESPYWERPQITKGDFMSRRDVGIKLSRSDWSGRLRSAIGVYSGVGETILGGTNDPSGGFEFIGRVEASYPENHNEEMIDVQGLTTPNISVGANIRYSNRILPSGATFLPGETGAMLNSSASAMELKVINGQKMIWGVDASFEYRNFSLQAETILLHATPHDSADAHLNGLPKSFTGGNFNAGGWYVQGNYYVKPAKLILSARYDQMNANDLVDGVSNHWACGVSYMLKGYNSMLKASFDQNLQPQSNLKYGGESINTNKWHNEFRIGWQLVID
ncbi:porin [Ferruginibacter albus]|uniref:porin n=1 Tax=Ferruginibacter albus TaxID=2875540 RepID=UPI001CC4AFA4|nr:porin [Ferruginibacter albus]UAY51129.1 OprO/OprP family phosphate-selective porin [Ferruginibacter albus]